MSLIPLIDGDSSKGFKNSIYIVYCLVFVFNNMRSVSSSFAWFYKTDVMDLSV